MPETADLAFARWCRMADPAALGELFDATAARLLRVAIHLVGDAAEAEDLVQQTFLALIEQRARLDGARPAWPWLTGVLANLARKHRRRAGRAREIEGASATAEDASRALERRELDGEVARAIDALEEPYREAVLLRLRHAMEPADIAHVLGRDPGTVRVQLHRGLEKLRAALPAGLVAGLALAWMAPRGFAAMRAGLVASASTAAAGSTSLALGGALVAKKLLVAAVAAALLFTSWWTLRADSTEPGAAPDATGSPARVASARAESPPPVLVSPPAHGRREDPAASSTTSAALRAGARVVDAETGESIAGASVALFAPRTSGVHELLAATPELYELGAHGELGARGGGDWPLVVAPSAAARFGREPVTAFDRPRSGEAPRARATTDGDGTFDLPLGVEDALLAGSAPGYATRWRAVRAGAELTTLALWREREVRGRVLVRLEAPPEPIELVLSGLQFPPPTHASRTRGTPEVLGAEDSTEPQAPCIRGALETLGAWVVRTAPDGSFVARVGATQFAVDVLTSGYGLRMPGRYEATREIQVFLDEFPLFRFRDAASGAPVERVRLLARELALDWPRWTGEFAAPGGRLTPPQALAFLLDGSSAIELFAWSDGYAPARVPLSRLGEPGVHDVDLEHGEAAALAGRILLEGAPLAGAEVALLAVRAISWSADDDALVDAQATGADGSFRLTAPPGEYLLRARTDGGPFLERVWFDESSSYDDRPSAGREPYFEGVSLPASRPLEIDLARTARIDVELVDARGAARPEWHVVMGGQDERQEWQATDESGRASFVRLPPGHYRLSLPPNGKRTNFSGEPARELDLATGEQALVRVELPPEVVRHGRIAARGTSDYSGWRARLGSLVWQEVEFDGALPMTLDPGHYTLEILAPDERRWNLALPEDLAPDSVFELDLGGLAYAGELLRADGSPWAGVLVFAATDVGNGLRHRVVGRTDASGRFELTGLGPAKPLLEFHTNLERELDDSWENELEGHQFEPEHGPSAIGRWLSMRVPGAGSMRVHGTLSDARRQPLAGKLLFADGHTPAPGGRWHVRGRVGSTRTDSQGVFELSLPAAPSVHVRVADEASHQILVDHEAAVTGDEVRLELVAP